jgi:hypothetical protein
MDEKRKRKKKRRAKTLVKVTQRGRFKRIDPNIDHRDSIEFRMSSLIG